MLNAKRRVSGAEYGQSLSQMATHPTTHLLFALGAEVQWACELRLGGPLLVLAQGVLHDALGVVESTAALMVTGHHLREVLAKTTTHKALVLKNGDGKGWVCM